MHDKNIVAHDTTTHPTGPPQRPTEVNVASHPAAGRPLVVALEGTKLGISAADQGFLRNWVERRVQPDPDALVVIGSPSPGNRSTRVTRLRALRDFIATLGVPTDRVRYTTDRVADRASPAEAAARSEPTAVVIKVSAERADRSMARIRDLFAGPRLKSDKELEKVCTSAS